LVVCLRLIRSADLITPLLAVELVEIARGFFEEDFHRDVQIKESKTSL